MNEICEILKSVVRGLFGVEIKPDLVEAPELERNERGFRADLATNVAMRLTGILSKQGVKENPRAVAEKVRGGFLAEVAKSDKLFGVQVEVAGPGFLNFMLGDEYLRGVVGRFAEDFDSNISLGEYFGKKVVVEFSDPNPFKVLHIGHLYTSMMGESISRIIELAGGEVHRVNFGGDVGLHVAKTLFALEKETPEDLTIEKIARAYVEGTRAYDEDEKVKKQITVLNKKIYEIAEKKLHDSVLAEKYWRGRELSYEYFDEFYERIGVKFEKYYPESTVATTGLEVVKAHVPDVYEESDGAVVFRGEKYGLHTRVFINREGLPTYEAKDVGLIVTKDKDYGFDESVVITGNDIVDYMKVVLKSVEQYAPELVKKTVHITHGNVRLPGNEKMSSRKGNFVKAVDVLDMVEKNLDEGGVGARNRQTVKTLANAAVKYALLKYKIGGNIEFDMKESVSMTGNSGVYLLYSVVRANKILMGVENNDTKNEVKDVLDWKLEESEVRIIKKIMQYPKLLGEVVKEKAPHLICNYLFETAQEFSRFYENCRVSGSEFETERKRIVRAFLNVMKHGLGLIGIETLEEM